MQIREFQVDDYPRVLALWEMVGLIVSRSDSLQGLRQQLERDADLFLVAEEDVRIIDIIMGRFDGRRGWINHLAVAHDHQNAGVGSLLVDTVEERLKARGCEKVNLLIERANASVQGFYDRLGYAGDDLIFMEKWLS